MLHDQLVSSLEHVDQADRPLRTLERIGLVDQHHRQAPTVGTELVTKTSDLLLSCEEGDTGGAPFLWRRNFGQVHVDCSLSMVIMVFAGGSLRVIV
jgi:hypothetical protein